MDLFLGGANFRRGLLLERILLESTANPNSPWAYIRKDLLSEGSLRLRFWGLIFGRAYCMATILITSF